MKKITLTLLIMLFAFGVFSQKKQPMNHNRYTNEWVKVLELERKSLPQSAAAVVDSILRRAVEDRNSPQIIKALIHRGKYELTIDGQNDTAIFNSLSHMLEQSTDVVERAVLHSMLGELYLQYYQKEQWIIQQRTELGNYVPADMKEWTRTIFYDKVVEHLNASLATQPTLEKVKVDTYAEVIHMGDDSRKFYPTLYDFLARRAIEVFSQMENDEELSRSLAKKHIPQPSLFAPAEKYVRLNFDPQPREYNLRALEVYRLLLTSLQERALARSVLLTELDKLDYLTRLQNAYAKEALPSFERLLEQWTDNDFSVEIIDKMADWYQHEIYRTDRLDSLKRMEKTEKLYLLLQSTIKRYPNYERISLLENKLLQLTQPEFSISGKNTFPVKGEKKLQVAWKNLRSLSAQLYSIDSPKDVQMANAGIRKEIDAKRTFVKNVPIALSEKPDYATGDTSFIVAVEEPGTYMLTFTSNPQSQDDNNNTDYYFAVSDLTLFSRSSAKDMYDFFVVNRVTGLPVKNAAVQIYKLPGSWHNSTLSLVASLPVNEMGLAVYNKEIPNNDVYYHAVAGNDNGSLLNRLPYGGYDYSERATEQREHVSIFTDRSLYRPGQTIYYKAVLIDTEENKHSVVSDKVIEFVLRDTNGREVATEKLKTNAFGSVTGEFVLPQGLLPGMFTIETEQGSVSLRVEEYKRPTFEITFDTIEQTYRFDEEITLKGKALSFSGIKLQDADVQYRITRRQSWWWRWGGSAEQYGEGSLTTDEEGSFEIRFTPEKSDGEQGIRSVYSFEVEATLTDRNGETQVGNYSVTVGDISMLLQLEMPERLEKENTEKIVITAKNLDEKEITAKGTYTIYSLHENDSIHQQVATGDFTTGEQPVLAKQLSKLPSGKYRVKLLSHDDRGNAIDAEKDLILFSYADPRPPIKTNSWLIERNTTFSPDRKAEVMLGVTDKVHVLYELWQENTLMERKWITLNNENRRFAFPYKTEYKNGITLMLTYVIKEQFHAHKVNMLPEKERKELKVKLDVFRDKIRPGTSEEWRITVTDNAGNPSQAEVLASMYDFSLDNIYPSQPWNLSLNSFNSYFSRMGLTADISYGPGFGRGYIHLPMKDILPFQFDRFNWFDFSLYHGSRMMFRSTNTKGLEEVMVVGYGASKVHVRGLSTQNSVAEDASLDEVFAMREAPPASPAPHSATGEKSAPQIRRNFNETAFFLPQLRTNEKGATQIAFTVPESNTRWRFRLLAHDKNLRVGKAEAFTVSQKELMVTPNMPRFLRHGDRTTIATKISNLSDSTVSGKVQLEFFDPVTDKVVENIPLSNQIQKFTLLKEASTDASWSFEVPTRVDLLGVRFVAQTDAFSDGEQHALAVLPHRMLVTESMRMDLNGSETKVFTMDRLMKRSSATIDDYRLTLEFASNPAWYAVQALPVLSDPVSDNAVSWFASYYANTLGAHIGKAYPKVAAMVEAWKKSGGSKETFLSNLEKNQELKNVLLEETPWVLEAQSESDQKERLSLLFDLNRSQHRITSALDKLKELQTTQGGWSWFKGFNPSVGITHYILYGFQQLKVLDSVAFSEEMRSMQVNGVSFIDAEAIRRFDALKKNNKEWEKIKTIPLTDLEYLYVRSAYDEQVPGEKDKEMTGFYLSVIEKNWQTYGLYERSLIARLMQRQGKAAVVQDILRSFREHATVSEEMGMFWANNKAHVFMSQSAVSVHTFIMDAFLAGGGKPGEIDNMKRWLLKQKQTQLWESTHATMDAVYALLSSGSDWFAAEGETRVTLGSLPVEPDSKEAGTGYFKETWNRSEILPAMGRVTVAHKGNVPAWGALYWQYYEEMDKITKRDASLDIEKLLFVEHNGASGPELVRITEENPLKVGDKVIVRLTVRTDRDLEFVHLKDMRAVAFEPVDQLSGMRWQNSVPYYQTSKDASTSLYFDFLPRGTWLFEYAVHVNRAGSYSNGITTIQCLYAPEFTSHTAGMRIIVK